MRRVCSRRVFAFGLVVAIAFAGLPAVEGLHASGATMGDDASAATMAEDAPKYEPRNVDVKPVTDAPLVQPKPSMPGVDVKAASGDAVVDAKGGTVDLEGLPLSVKLERDAVPNDTRVHVEVLEPKLSERISRVGYAFQVTFRDDASRKILKPTGEVLVELNYSALAHQYAGDFVDRLHVITVPECRLEAAKSQDAAAASDPSCPASRPLMTVKNDKDHSTLTVDLGPGGLQPLTAVAISGGKDGSAVPASATDTESTQSGAVKPSPTASTSTSTATSSSTSTTTSPDARSSITEPGTPSSTVEGSASTSTTTESTSTTAAPTVRKSTTTTAPSVESVDASDASAESAAGAATLSGGGTFALTSGTAGDSGNYGATPVAGVGSSEVGLQSGSAQSAYPIEVPPAPAGPTPEVTLQYSSASVDGFTTDHNTQASEVGIGWQLNTGSITREFKACNTTDAPGDLCWAGENYQITLNGVSDRLIPKIGSNNNEWRLQHDPYWKVERLLRSDDSYVGFDRTIRYPDNSNGFAWFQVTTPDGTKYRFGGEVEPGTNNPQQSIWNVPVYNPGANDPCHNRPNWMCLQGWRWNLDRVEDTSGNVTSYFYAATSNYYNARSGQAGPWSDYGYRAGGYLTKIEYTKRAGAENAVDFHQWVLFGYANRCAAPCQSAADFVDTPLDLYCTPGFPTCDQGSPSFWGMMRLDTITTQIRNATWDTVKQYQLSQSYPDPDPSPPRPSTVAASYRKLQLDTITRAGASGQNVGQPTRFGYSYLYNRVAYSNLWSPDGAPG